MISLFTRFRGSGARYGNYIYIAPQKVGSTMIGSTGTHNFNFDDSNFLRIIEDKFQLPHIIPTLRIFIRDPYRRYMSGAIENMFMDTSKPGSYYKTNYFSETLFFKNNGEFLKLKKTCDEKYLKWIKSDYISDNDKKQLYKLAEIYFKYQAEIEIYTQTHTMPFYTALYGLLISSKVKFETLYLEEFNFPLDRLQQENVKQLKHSKKIFLPTVREALFNVSKPSIMKMLEMENTYFKKLDEHHTKEFSDKNI